VEDLQESVTSSCVIMGSASVDSTTRLIFSLPIRKHPPGTSNNHHLKSA
jgi:hypothetical protein